MEPPEIEHISLTYSYKYGIAKILCIVCLALSVNTGCKHVVNGIVKSGQNPYVRQTLLQLGTEAARELLQIVSAPRADAKDAKGVAFTDDEWLVAIVQNGNDLTYQGVNLKTRESLTLRKATVSGDSQRKVYTWNNGDYRYQLAWQPSDPQVIRLQVFNGREELLNRLLHQTNNG